MQARMEAVTKHRSQRQTATRKRTAPSPLQTPPSVRASSPLSGTPLANTPAEKDARAPLAARRAHSPVTEHLGIEVQFEEERRQKMGAASSRGESDRGHSWHWPSTPEHTQSLERSFGQLFDKDGNKDVSAEELTHVLHNLGEYASADLCTEMIILASGGQKSLKCSEFVNIMTGVPCSSPRTLSKKRESEKDEIDEIERVFHVIDEDGSGYLDEQEVSKLASKMDNKSFKRSALIDAMSAMDPGDSRNQEQQQGAARRALTGASHCLVYQLSGQHPPRPCATHTRARTATQQHSVETLRYKYLCLRLFASENTRKVTLPMFRTWWHERQYKWSDMIVLPEYLVSIVRSEAGLEPDTSEDPYLMWQRLSRLLKAVVKTLEQKADIMGTDPTNLYGDVDVKKDTTLEVENEAKAKRCFL